MESRTSLVLRRGSHEMEERPGLPDVSDVGTVDSLSFFVLRARRPLSSQIMGSNSIVKARPLRPLRATAPVPPGL